ncbi:MAG: NAD(P)H-binding protein [Polyangia bacterium]
MEDHPDSRSGIRADTGRSPQTFLVTGATGNIGRRVVAGLLAAGHRPRAFVRNAEKARQLLGGSVELITGDLGDETALASACAGVRGIFLLAGGADLAAIDARAARAARAGGVGHIVKLSSMGGRAAGAATAIAQWHANGEDAIRASGVPHVFVRSVGFMSNALAWAPTIKAAGIVRASTGDGRIAMIHPDDVAEVSVRALLAGPGADEVLCVTGPEPLTYAQMTAKLAAILGRPLTFAAISDDSAVESLLAVGMPLPVAHALVALWREVREGAVDLVSPDVQRITGHRPRSFEQWAAENAPAFR